MLQALGRTGNAGHHQLRRPVPRGTAWPSRAGRRRYGTEVMSTDEAHRLDNYRRLVVEFGHGNLVVAMGVELPAARNVPQPADSGKSRRPRRSSRKRRASRTTVHDRTAPYRAPGGTDERLRFTSERGPALSSGARQMRSSESQVHFLMTGRSAYFWRGEAWTPP
jgi:hypothetical protein